MRKGHEIGVSKNAWIYCRVANNAQSIIETQHEELIRFANQHGFNIVGISQDVGSGLDYARKGLSEITEAVRSKRAGVVLIKDISRIGRDISENIAYIKEINALGALFLSPIDGVIDTILPDQVYSYFSTSIGQD
jgi:DNA invertase Pin-like site-specific DNA recombinase